MESSRTGQGMARDAYGYIVKPFDERELRASIALAPAGSWTDRFRCEHEAGATC